MSVWLTIPSARPAEQVIPLLKKWKERGYKIAVAMDKGREPMEPWDIVCVGEYPGYAKSVNLLIEKIRILDEHAEWFVAAGDDIEPDPNHAAEEIAEQCGEHFRQTAGAAYSTLRWARTFGVMQPTGDRWGDKQGAYIDRVAGSAWIGLEFVKRAYDGKGPLCPEYYHMFVDQELQDKAQQMGRFWQRPDLTQYHDHWGRPRPGEAMGQYSRMPEFLKKANDGFLEAKAIFQRRKTEGFPTWQ